MLRIYLFIGPQEFVVGYSKAPEQPQSCAGPMCHSHTMTSPGREPATIRIAIYRSSPRYAWRHVSVNNLFKQILSKDLSSCLMRNHDDITCTLNHHMYGSKTSKEDIPPIQFLKMAGCIDGRMAGCIEMAGVAVVVSASALLFISICIKTSFLKLIIC